MSTPALLTPQQFAGKVRAKYPGAYDSFSDEDLTQKVLSKYPEYGGQVQLATSGPAKPNVNVQMDSNPAAGVAGFPGSSPNLRPASDAEVGLGAAGLGAGALATYGPMAASAALPFIQKHPILATMAAQEGIHQARQLPVVGRHIPAMAEWLPWLIPGLAGGGKPRIGGEPDATLNRTNIPEYAGEDFGPTEPTQLQQSKPLGSIQARPDEPQAPSATPEPQAPTAAPERYEMTPERQNLFQRILGQTTAEHQAERAREATQADEDLTPILKKSLQQARARKAIGAGVQGTQQP